MDEVAAEHIQADSIIHFGHSCLSVPSKLPVLFVFGNSPCDLNELEQGLKNAYLDPDTKIVVLFDTQYNHCRGEYGLFSLEATLNTLAYFLSSICRVFSADVNPLFCS